MLAASEVGSHFGTRAEAATIDQELTDEEVAEIFLPRMRVLKVEVVAHEELDSGGSDSDGDDDANGPAWISRRLCRVCAHCNKAEHEGRHRRFHCNSGQKWIHSMIHFVFNSMDESHENFSAQ
jgi:hypothetical protein